MTHLNESQLSAMAGRQLPLFSLIIPAWMIVALAGWRGLRGVWPAIVVCGLTFASVQFFISNFWGPTLVDVAGGLASLAALAIMLRFWQPRSVWQFPDERLEPSPSAAMTRHCYSRREVAFAWGPWIILSLCVFLWGLPPIRTFLDGGLPPATSSSSEADQSQRWWERPNLLAVLTDLKWKVPFLDEQIQPDPAISGGDSKPKPAEFRFNWLSATGTGIFVATILSAFWMGMTPFRYFRTLRQTVYRLRSSLFTIACMLGIAYTTQYSGTDVTLGLAFTRTGVLYPLFAAMLGWLGVALTGSDTSSNALFGNLQRLTAERLNLNPILICAANSTGGVMGKMVDAQSIVVASAATGQQGEEGRILRFVFWHSIVLAVLVGLLTMIQAYLLPGMIPTAH